MTLLIPGANAAVGNGELSVTIDYSPLSGADIDCSAFLLTTAGKVRGDGDMCFYGQPEVQGGQLILASSQAGKAVFRVHLASLDAAVEKLALTATIYENRARFADISQLKLAISGGITAVIDTSGMEETALILGEFYRRQGHWKFRCIGQGFVGGLAPLAEYFGVEVAKEDPRPQLPKPPPESKSDLTRLNLSKITLDKSRSSISLAKAEGAHGFGEIRVNLNWNRSGGEDGLFSHSLGSREVDLDLGCLFELRDGSKGAVQALGDSFGSFHQEPHIQLMGDDRTGSVTTGEWLHINGQHWDKISRILIYAFIYEGAPNWPATDGVVTLYVPDQAPIEVRVSEEGGRQGMCAIALLENSQEAVKISRQVKFFRGHQAMDRAYQWGMRWSSASKD